MRVLEKEWSERLQAMVHGSEVVLHAKLEEPDGESFVLTLEEMKHVLDLLSQAKSVVSHDRLPLTSESVHGPLDDLLASFAYQRAL